MFEQACIISSGNGTWVDSLNVEHDPQLPVALEDDGEPDALVTAPEPKAHSTPTTVAVPELTSWRVCTQWLGRKECEDGRRTIVVLVRPALGPHEVGKSRKIQQGLGPEPFHQRDDYVS